MKKLLKWAFIVTALFIAWAAWKFYLDFPNPPAIFITHVEPKREYIFEETSKVKGRYASIFTDRQAVQIVAARRMGIKPISEEDIDKELEKGRLERVSNTNLYYLFPSKYSVLTPEAKDLLAQIGVMYQKNLGNNNARLRLTSCLRTKAYIKKLRKVNSNAVENSCHLYGTTFDLSYNYMNMQQRQALACALQSLRKAGYCYVVYEVRQPCFHITVRK